MNSYCSECREVVHAGGLCSQCEKEFCAKHWGYRGGSTIELDDGVWSASIEADTSDIAPLCFEHAHAVVASRVDPVWRGLKGRPLPSTTAAALETIAWGRSPAPPVRSFRPIAPPPCVPGALAELWRRYLANDRRPVDAAPVLKDVALVLRQAGRTPPEITLTEQYTTGWSNKVKTRKKFVRAWRLTVDSWSDSYESGTIEGVFDADGNVVKSLNRGQTIKPERLPTIAADILKLLGVPAERPR